MQQFFKFMFASCLGVFLAIGALIVFGIASAASSLGGEETVKEAKANSILEIKLESSVPELTDNAERSSPFESNKVIGLHDMTRAIEKAANDDHIKGIVINTRMTMMGFSSASVLRRAITNFKKSGKFVYAYGDMYTQGAYYLASSADTVMINPYGDIDFKGIAAQIPFMKGLFDKLDVKWQIYYAGQFKSATEPFRLDKMSDQNRLQTREYIDGLFNLMLTDISASRKIPVSELKNIANDLKARTPHKAVASKLADTEGYYDALLSMVKRKMGLKETEKISSINLNDYAQSLTRTTGTGKDKIAVVFAEGDIGYGSGESEVDGSIEGLRYAKIIRKLRNDKNVKAIVLRVNSGGGSSFASEIIWRELDLARQQGKIVMSSFGDYAASGGYYIAMASDSIFAEPNTLTGSIGVFGMIPGMQNTFKNKLGITFDTVKTSKFAAMSGVNIHFSDEEGKILQEGVDSTYETFLNRVAICRKMSRDQVHAIAQGRVWLGNKAKEIGLVDQMGGLESAITAAANKAGLKDYKTVNYPTFKSPMEKFLEKFTGGKSNTDEITQLALKNELGEFYEYYAYFKKLKTMHGPQMRLPYVVQLK
jgi:protease IV